MNARKLGIAFYLGVLIMIALPLFSLVTSLGRYPIKIMGNSILMDALVVSGKTSIVMMLIVLLVGTPAAYIKSRFEFKGKRLFELFLDLPLVLPPAVAGLLLLMTFGTRGVIGTFLSEMDVQIPFTMVAVIIAQLFVALPIYIKTVSEGFNKVDPLMERTAMTLGDTRWQAFYKVSLPLVKGSILTGAIMAWARGLAEFGATIMFAGNLPSVTQTLPLAIYSAMETDLGAAMNIARLMVIISLSVLIITYKLTQKGDNFAQM